MRRRSAFGLVEQALSLRNDVDWDSIRAEGHALLAVPSAGAWAVTENSLARQLGAKDELSPSSTHWRHRPLAVSEDDLSRGLLHMPEALFLQVHSALVAALGARRNAAWLGRVEAVTASVCSHLRAEREIDLVSQILVPVAQPVALELVGVPPPEAQVVSNTASANPGRASEILQQAVTDHMRAVWREERTGGVLDIARLARLAPGSNSGEQIATGVAISIVEATLNNMLDVLVASCATIMSQPGLMRSLSEETELVDGILEELLRFCARGMGAVRFARSPFHIGAYEIRAGDLIFAPPRAVNFDPNAFEHAQVFNPFRKGSARHLSFGLTPYDCPAGSLARAQLSAVLATLAREFPGLTTRGEVAHTDGKLFGEVSELSVAIG